MTIHQFFLILLARWRSALLVFMAAVGVAVGVSLVLPKQYSASASVMLDVRSPDPVAGMMMGMMGPGYMATQVDLITSERVARKAIQTLKLNENQGTRNQWIEATGGKGDFEAWLADNLLKNLDIKPSRESTIITIGYQSPDPGFSAGMANAFMQAYVDTTLELRVGPARQYNSFFETRAKQLREDFEAAQAKHSKYMKANGLLATDERLDVENARLSELSSQLVMLQALAAESGGRQAQAAARPEQMQEVMNNSLVATLSADVAREESRMKELTSRLGDSHPQVLEGRARLAELLSRLQGATSSATGSVVINNSVNKTRVAQIKSSLDSQRSKVIQLKSVRDEAAVLQRDVENAQRAYDAMTQRVTQAGVESQTTQTNVSIIKRASPPNAASSPNIRRNLLIAVFVGTLLAVGFALAREFMDRRLRTESDVLAELKQPLLVVLPQAKHSAQKRETSRMRMLKARVMSGQPNSTTSTAVKV